jgi:uncharacterized protein (DUF1778 family)
MEIRVTPELKSRIEAAAAIKNVTASQLVRSVLEDRMREILDDYWRRTTVPADFFDALIASLDDPPEPSEATQRAKRRLAELNVERRW